MSQTHRKFSAEFKSKVVLELLESGSTVSEIASKYKLLPNSIIAWKKQFLSNAASVFEDATSKKLKSELKEKEEKIESLEKTLGRTVMERDWLQKKVASLGLIEKLSLVDPKLALPITRQCQILEINRTTAYYERRIKTLDMLMLNRIDEIYTDFPYYGHRRIFHVLNLEGYDANPKKVLKYMKILNIQALYPIKKRNTSIPDCAHKKYPYLLRSMEITKPNHAWASDISYIRLKNGFAYLCAIIDLHTRSILSWRLSNTMDERLTASVLNDALSVYGKPSVFNSDQGSQYTAKSFIDILVRNGVSISMDSKGRAYDNIIMERFWRTVKYENVYPSGYETIAEANTGISAYIRKYNNERLHSSLDYKAPLTVYNDYFKKAA